MGLKNDRPSFSFKRLLKSFHYAMAGLKHTWKKEQNFRIHLLFTIVVILFAQLLKVPIVEQVLLFIVIGLVLSLELINTAIENVVDMITKTYDKRAKIVKDVAAGAVLIFSIIAVIIGILIFVPKIVELFL